MKIEELQTVCAEASEASDREDGFARHPNRKPEALPGRSAQRNRAWIQAKR